MNVEQIKTASKAEPFRPFALLPTYVRFQSKAEAEGHSGWTVRAAIGPSLCENSYIGEM